MSGHWLVAVVAAVLGALLAPSVTRSQKTASPPSCSRGRFLVQSPTLIDPTAMMEALVIEGDRISIGTVCPPVLGKFKNRARVMKVTAVWPECGGLTGKVRLRATVELGCTRIYGSFVARKAKVRKLFSGLQSECGDNMIDPEVGEECERSTECGTGLHCEGCVCVEGVTTPTTTTQTTTSTTASTSTSSTRPATTSTTASTSTSTTQRGTTSTTTTTSSTTTRPVTTSTSTTTTRPTTTTTTTRPTTTTTTSSTTTTRRRTTTTTTTTSTTTTTLGQVSFSAHVMPILTPKCATQATCHGSTPPAQNLDLRPGVAYRAMVNVNSTECTTTKLVLPGDPNASYVMWKIRAAGPCLLGTRMPPVIALSAANQAVITAWIQQGALDN